VTLYNDTAFEHHALHEMLLTILTLYTIVKRAPTAGQASEFRYKIKTVLPLLMRNLTDRACL